MPEAKRKLAAWMDLHMRKRKLSQNALAKLTGIGLTTINRYCNPDSKNEPRINHVMTLARFFGDRPPIDLGPGDGPPGFPEDGVEPIVADPEKPGFDPNLSHWTVRDNTMQGLGYMPGDIVTANAALQAADGDVVVCNLYSMDGKTARTALRMFKAPSYLISASSDTKDLEIHEVGKTAAIFGVIFESRRLRQAS